LNYCISNVDNENRNTTSVITQKAEINDVMSRKLADGKRDHRNRFQALTLFDEQGNIVRNFEIHCSNDTIKSPE